MRRPKDTIKSIREALKKEKRWLLDSYILFDQVKNRIEKYKKSGGTPALGKETVTGVREEMLVNLEDIIKRISICDQKLESHHKKVLNKLKELQTYSPYSLRVMLIEKKINDQTYNMSVDITNLKKEIDTIIKGGGIRKTRDWRKLEEIIISKIEKDIKIWLDLDKELINLINELKEGNLVLTWLKRLFERPPKPVPAKV